MPWSVFGAKGLETLAGIELVAIDGACRVVTRVFPPSICVNAILTPRAQDTAFWGQMKSDIYR